MIIDKVYSKTKKLRNRHFLFLDFIFALTAPFFALVLRLDGIVSIDPYLYGLIIYTLSFSMLKILVLFNFRIYSLFWSKGGFDEIQNLGYALLLNMIVHVFLFNFLDNILIYPFSSLPSSLPYLDGIVFMILCFTSRFSIRMFEHLHDKKIIENNNNYKVLVLGAGYAGINIVESMQKDKKAGYQPQAFLDDNNSKQRLILRGIPILGGIPDLPNLLKKKSFDYVVIAMPRVSGEKVRFIAESCRENNVKLLTIPSIAEIFDGKVNVSRMREVKIEDLLRREQVNTNLFSMSELIKGRRVLVTGGGGSIGSELCRQLIKLNPSSLIILGHGENSVFEIEQELKGVVSLPEYSCTKLYSFIADLRMKDRLQNVFTKYKPNLVFHAAAHKHVPLMEDNAQEAISNNVIGTKNLVDLAIENDVMGFIGISTDKAVNPTNIMGATKRVSEMIILDAAKKTGRYFSVVRFGNVLGSRGSVVKTFEQQIKKGGPITLTHPDIIRYFMTIPEAVQLVLQASILGRGGNVFVLDMGKPVRILDLAEDMIRLSGMNGQIDIKITGLRPGEKLYEELYLADEYFVPTEHNKIFSAQNGSQFISPNLYDVLKRFTSINDKLSKREIIILLKRLVPEFKHKENVELKENIPHKKLG